MKNNLEKVIQVKETNNTILLLYMLSMSKKCLLLIFVSQTSSIMPAHTQHAINVWGINEWTYLYHCYLKLLLKRRYRNTEGKRKKNWITKGTKLVGGRIEGDKRPWLLLTSSWISYATTSGKSPNENLKKLKRYSRFPYSNLHIAPKSWKGIEVGMTVFVRGFLYIDNALHFPPLSQKQK